MTTEIQPLPTPPAPTDTPSEFNSKAFSLLGALPQFVTQANLLGGELTKAAQDAANDAEAARLSKEDAAGSAEAAGTHAGHASTSAGQAAGSAGSANTAKQAAEQARDAAQGYAASMGQAIAMAATFTTVPATFQAWCIVVTSPHLRFMVWNASQSKYVRAPWHQPCQVFFSYDNPASIPGALPVRGDASWNQADFPDVVARLGLSGVGTFTLIEARGEGVRVLDNGRGIDSGRVLRSAQADAFQGHRMLITPEGYTVRPLTTEPGSAGSAGGGLAGNYTQVTTGDPTSNGVHGTPRTAAETRMRNIAFPLWMTY